MRSNVPPVVEPDPKTLRPRSCRATRTVQPRRDSSIWRMRRAYGRRQGSRHCRRRTLTDADWHAAFDYCARQACIEDQLSVVSRLPASCRAAGVPNASMPLLQGHQRNRRSRDANARELPAAGRRIRSPHSIVWTICCGRGRVSPIGIWARRVLRKLALWDPARGRACVRTRRMPDRRRSRHRRRQSC